MLVVCVRRSRIAGRADAECEQVKVDVRSADTEKNNFPSGFTSRERNRCGVLALI